MAIASVNRSLTTKRENEAFELLFTQAAETRHKQDLDEITTPRVRHPPRRYTGPAEGFQPESIKQYYRLEYFKAIDTAQSELVSRLEQEGLQIYEQL